MTGRVIFWTAVTALTVAAAPALANTEPGLLVRLTQDIQAWQGELYRNLAGGVRAIREEGSLAALSALLMTSFLYGVLHAAGPGHGKVVLSAYLAAGPRRLGEGVVLALLSALAQALTAIIAVGLVAAVLGFVAQEVLGAAYWLERASFVLIAALGLYLIGRAVWPNLLVSGHSHGAQPARAADSTVMGPLKAGTDRHQGHEHTHDHGHDCNHDAHQRENGGAAACGHHARSHARAARTILG